MKLVRVGKEFVNLDKVHRVLDKIEENGSLILLFEPLTEDNTDITGMAWSGAEFHGDEAKALLDWLNRNSNHIA